MKKKKELIAGWLDKANKDLLSAEHEISFSDAVTETICFHCQQAVEKFLNAYLIYLDISFFKTHEIGELITQCETKDQEISQLKEDADELTDYAVELRYPDYSFEPSMADATRSLKVAAKIKKYVTQKIQL